MLIFFTQTPLGYIMLVMDKRILQTVVETPEFIRRTGFITERKIVDDFIVYIAGNPKKGELIEGTGGARKIRWQTSRHAGKSGGMRVIYFYHDQTVPVFLFTAYAKNERANISAPDKKVLKMIIKQIVTAYKGGNDE